MPHYRDLRADKRGIRRGRRREHRVLQVGIVQGDSRDTREAKTTRAGMGGDVGRRRRNVQCPGVSTQKKSDSPELSTALSNCRLEREDYGNSPSSAKLKYALVPSPIMT